MTQLRPLLERLSGIVLDDLASFDRAEFLAAGLSPARVAEYHLVHSAYFGAAATPAAATPAATSAADVARASELCVDMLAQIERSIRHIHSDKARRTYRLRLLSAATSTATTCAAIARYAKAIVPPKAAGRRKGARFSASIGGLRTAVITADEHVMADLEAALRQGLDDSQPAAPLMASAFEDLMRSGSGVPAAVPRPLILVPAPQLARILRDHGPRPAGTSTASTAGSYAENTGIVDTSTSAHPNHVEGTDSNDPNDIRFGLTDGTTISGAEFVNAYLADPAYGLADTLEAALFHPTEGPVNLYRTRRLASPKQRTLAMATQPVCANPDCRKPADLCQIHHVTAWKHGGETNLDNLAVVCSYHNRVNDDDEHIRKRGRIEIRHGRPIWVSPTGYSRANTRHQYGAMHALFGSPPSGHTLRLAAV